MLLQLNTPDIEHRTLAISAVTSAVSFLEALVNETYQDAADHGHGSSRIAGLSESTVAKMQGAWRVAEMQMRTLDKFQTALEFANVPMFTEGESPLQPTSTLVKLRNLLIHPKPKWDSVDGLDKFCSRLSTSEGFVENQQPIGMPWFPNKALGAGCADWACKTSRSFAEGWLDRISIPRIYETDLAGFPEP